MFISRGWSLNHQREKEALRHFNASRETTSSQYKSLAAPTAKLGEGTFLLAAGRRIIDFESMVLEAHLWNWFWSWWCWAARLPVLWHPCLEGSRVLPWPVSLSGMCSSSRSTDISKAVSVLSAPSSDTCLFSCSDHFPLEHTSSPECTEAPELFLSLCFQPRGTG